MNQSHTHNKTALQAQRSSQFAEWYQEVIQIADLAETSPVRGCMIVKPRGYAIWERIQASLDAMIKETGHDNVYFPLLIPLSFLSKEAEHVEGFAKECAVVTHYRLEKDNQGGLQPAPEAKLTEPFVIRPTSETLFGHAMSSWVQSYKDLPLLLNQWSNVMRWEMRTRLFLRTSEFLWQEGHTAHETEQQARTETLQMLEVYRTLLQDVLAIPVIVGEKTPLERFPGAQNTYSIEAMMQDGKALQAGTSHFLGQNFARAYDIIFADAQQQQQYAWTTSWGVSTRLIGALIMTHSDDNGLVLPPRVAPQQVVITPYITNEADAERILNYCEKLKTEISSNLFLDEKIRVRIDQSSKRGGEKVWDAIKCGIPIRIEVGLREIEADYIVLSRRDQEKGIKEKISRQAVIASITTSLSQIQQTLYERADQRLKAQTQAVNSLADFEKAFAGGENDIIGFVLAYVAVPQFEKHPECEALFKALKVTSRCRLLQTTEQPQTCIFTGLPTYDQVIFARAY